MTRDDALRAAWIAWHEGIDPGLIPSEPTTAFRVGFCAGWDARKAPNLQPVIDYLDRGHDPRKAAEELRVYQAQRDAE